MDSNLQYLTVDKRGIKSQATSVWTAPQTQEEWIQFTAGGTTNLVQRLAQSNPWINKATIMTALAVSQLPFDILDDNDKVIDASSEWHNVIGGMPTPGDLLFKLASSLCLGRAYLIPRFTGRMIIDLQYCEPSSVLPNINTTGLVNFYRTTAQGQPGIYYPADGDNNPTLMYFWLPDRDVEIGPALSYPAGTALESTGLLNAMNQALLLLARNGFVTKTLLFGAGGELNIKEKREEMNNLWDRFYRGLSGRVMKILNIDKMDAMKVGATIDEIAALFPPLTQENKESIAAAFGIPAAIYMADMAFASEVNPLIKTWYSTSVFNLIYSTIEMTFNTQLLHRWNYRLKFKPESLDAFQEEEVDRSGAFKTYVDAGGDPVEVAKMLGMETADGQTYEQIFPKKETPPALQPFSGQNNPPQDQNQPIPLEMPRQNLTAAMTKDLDLWRQLAVRNFKKGKGNAIDFECKALPTTIAEDIRARLKDAKTEDEIVKAFEINAPDTSNMSYAILKAVELLERIDTNV